MDEAQFNKSFAHLTPDEFAELVVGFTDDGVPVCRDSAGFVKLWNI